MHSNDSSTNVTYLPPRTESADGGPSTDLLSMVEEVGEMAAQVFGIQAALKRIGRKHLHFWLHAADAHYTTHGSGEQLLENWEPRLPSIAEQGGGQSLSFTPVAGSSFTAPSEGSEAFNGVKVTITTENSCLPVCLHTRTRTKPQRTENRTCIIDFMWQKTWFLAQNSPLGVSPTLCPV